MREFTLDEQSGVPLWIQVRNRIIYLVKSGYYVPGQQLPTVRELAIELKINYNTVNKVYKSLESDGIIETRRGRGTFVPEDISHLLLTQDEDAQLETLADELIHAAHERGMGHKEVLELLEKRYDALGT